PHTREIIYSFMRLRALRVEVDVNLALGELTLEQAAKYLEQKVSMDANTARQEAIAFSTGPGQALTYQICKRQLMKFLAEARMKKIASAHLRHADKEGEIVRLYTIERMGLRAIARYFSGRPSIAGVRNILVRDGVYRSEDALNRQRLQSEERKRIVVMREKTA